MRPRQDLIDMRRSGWQARRKQEGPKKIEDIHRDAAMERSRCASRDERVEEADGGAGLLQRSAGVPRPYAVTCLRAHYPDRTPAQHLGQVLGRGAASCSEVLIRRRCLTLLCLTCRQLSQVSSHGPTGQHARRRP